MKPLPSLCLVCLLPLLFSEARAQTFTPAGFGSFNAFQDLEISPDDLPRGTDSLAVRCQGFVETNGDLTNYYCISDDALAQAKAVTAVIDAVPMQAFEAASVNGQNVRVYMNFAVLIQCLADECLTIPIRNHGYKLVEYGLNYVDPQPILPTDEWYEGFEYKLEWLRSWMPDVARIDDRSVLARVPFTISLEVDAIGVSSSACAYTFGPLILPPGVRKHPDLPLKLKRAVDSMTVQFIPGFRDGQPTTMRFYESGVIQGHESNLRDAEVRELFAEMRCDPSRLALWTFR